MAFVAPCPALEMEDGKASCGLVAHPQKYVDIGSHQEWKDAFLGGFITRLLGIGMGCDLTIPET